MSTIIICEDCGEEMSRESIPVEVAHGNRRVTLQQPGWWCWTCRVGRHSAADLIDPPPPPPPRRR